MDDDKTQKPPLPPGAPDDIAEFVEGTRTKVLLPPGKASWLPSPTPMGTNLPPPEVIFGPGDGPGKVAIYLRYELVSVKVTADVVDGQLVVDAGTAATTLGLGDSVTDWVAKLNRWLAANGWQLAPLTVSAAGVTLDKVAVTPPPVQTPPPPKKARAIETQPRGRELVVIAVGVVALAAAVALGAVIVTRDGGNDEEVATNRRPIQVPILPTARPGAPATTQVDMPYTIVSVGPSCDQSVQGSVGQSFAPLKYSLKRSGNNLELSNADGTSVGRVVATGTVDARGFSMRTPNPAPDQGLALFALSGGIPPPGMNPSGNGELWGANDCKVAIQFELRQAQPVLTAGP